MMPSSSTSVDHELIIHLMYGLDNFIIGKTKKRREEVRREENWLA
jgi:hypothetical protein